MWRRGAAQLPSSLCRQLLAVEPAPAGLWHSQAAVLPPPSPAPAPQSPLAYRLICSLAPQSAARGQFQHWAPVAVAGAEAALQGSPVPRPLQQRLQQQQQQQSRGFLAAASDCDTSKKYHERRLIGYSPQQIYEVVTQVQHYKDFVPWCQNSVVVRDRPPGYVEAELEVGFKMFTERYTSCVRCEPPSRVVTTVEDSTLFRHMDSAWAFQPGPLPQSCWLDFSIDFAFRSPLYRSVASVFFNEVVRQMMCAFEGRCRALYGESALARRQGPPTQHAAKVGA